MAGEEFQDLTRPRRCGRFVDSDDERTPGFIWVEYRPPGFMNALFNRTKIIHNVPKEGLKGPFMGPDYPPDGFVALTRSEGGYKGFIDEVRELEELRTPELDRKITKLELKSRAAIADRELTEKSEKERLAEKLERREQEIPPEEGYY